MGWRTSYTGWRKSAVCSAQAATRWSRNTGEWHAIASTWHGWVGQSRFWSCVKCWSTWSWLGLYFWAKVKKHKQVYLMYHFITEEDWGQATWNNTTILRLQMYNVRLNSSISRTMSKMLKIKSLHLVNKVDVFWEKNYNFKKSLNKM